MAETRSRHFGTINAVDPTTGRCDLEVYVTHRRAQAVKARGPAAIMEMAELVPEALERPTAMFWGIREDQDDDNPSDGWLCYCSRPSRSYRPDSDGRAQPSRPYDNQVFAVFVNHERVVYNWRWEDADSENSALPVDWRERFKGRSL